MKKITKAHLKEEVKSIEYESVIMRVEQVIETKKKIKKPYGTEKPQKVSRIDVLILIDEFKNKFKKINEKAKEIAQKQDRTIVTYNDTEEAIRLIRAENEHSEKFDQLKK